MADINQIETWLQQEQQIRARMDAGVGPGVASPQQLANTGGLDMLQGMLRGIIPHAPMARTLDFLLVEASEGRAIFQGRPGPTQLNPMGTLHGGWYATLLDSAMGAAVYTLMPPGRGYTTADMNVHLVRGIGPDAVRVRAEGFVIHCGSKLATAEARLIGPDGTLYAHATSTCLVFDHKR